jgi:predicted kinase
MRDLFVVVSGAPGSGKSTIAQPLARALDLPLLAKDTIKEALGDELPVASLAESQRLGKATMRVLIALAEINAGAVLESTWHSALAIPDLQRLRSPIVEVNCNVPPDVARDRYVARAGTRHPVHFDVEQGGDVQGWIERHPQCINGPWPLITVDTTQPVDIAALVARILAA